VRVNGGFVVVNGSFGGSGAGFCGFCFWWLVVVVMFYSCSMMV